MIIITTRKRLRELIARELADMIETDPVTRGLIARPARSSAKDWLQDLTESLGMPYRPGSQNGQVAEMSATVGRLFKAAVR